MIAESKLSIACTAGGRGHGVPVIDAINAEEAKSPAVIGIDQGASAQTAAAGRSRQRADADRQTAPPLGRGIRIGNKQSHRRSVLRAGSGWPAGRGRPRRRARACGRRINSAMMSWLAGNRKRHQRSDHERPQMPPLLQVRWRGQALKDVPGGLRRPGAEDHTGQQDEDYRQRPTRPARAVAARSGARSE